MFYFKRFFIIIALFISLICIYLCYSPRSEYDDCITEYSRLYGVSEDVIRAVCHAESRFRSDVTSSRGAIGVMQILPDTGRQIAEELGVADFSTVMLFDPGINIRFGCYYLSYLYKRFDEDWCVFAAYNAGEGRVVKWLDDGIGKDDIPFSETKKYVRKVERYVRWYRNKKVLSFY